MKTRKKKAKKISIVIAIIFSIFNIMFLYSSIGNSGSLLCGYATILSTFFILLISLGIPNIFSNVMIECNVMGEYDKKERYFKYAKWLILAISFIAFILLIILAPLIANIALGGSTIKELVFVLRMSFSTLLVVPITNLYKSYFQGHAYNCLISRVNICELIMVNVISFLITLITVYVVKVPIYVACGWIILSIPLSSLLIYLYLFEIRKIKYKQLNAVKLKKAISYIQIKELINVLVKNSTPIYILLLYLISYKVIDTLTLTNLLDSKYKYSTLIIGNIMSTYLLWGLIFTILVIKLGVFIINKLLPKIKTSYLQKDTNGFKVKISKSYQVISYLIVPSVVILSLLSESIWYIFFGTTNLTYQYMSFEGLFLVFYLLTIYIYRSFGTSKKIYISILLGMIIKILFNTPLLTGFYKSGLPAYHGAITANMFGYMVATIYLMICLFHKYKIHYESIIKESINVIISSVVMVIIYYVCKLFIPLPMGGRIATFLITLIYITILILVYIAMTMKTKTVENIFSKK